MKNYVIIKYELKPEKTSKEHIFERLAQVVVEIW